MELWPHQKSGLLELKKAIAEGERNICLTSPTGGGKSNIMFNHMEDECKTPTLYTDRRMLLKQLASDLNKRGESYGVRAAGIDPDLNKDIQLCMIQTEASRSLGNITERVVHKSDTIIVDEAHKNAGETVQNLLDNHRKMESDSILIGFTATPLNIGHLYSKLIVAGTNSQLRKCGALVPARHYGPDEPDTKEWIKKVVIGDGECGIPNRKRMEFAQRVYGRIIENYWIFNPDQKPSILFAPGVKESIWLAQNLTANGIKTAHLDGENVWLDGKEQVKTDELVQEIAERSRDGDIKIISNRFVLREGINYPFLQHCIFATVFGSLTSYIQAGGRVLRNHPSMDHVVIQDHGGNWHRHGSLNTDRVWELGLSDRIACGVREQSIREKKEPEPIHCPKCSAIRLTGPVCHDCGYKNTTRSRPVLQKDGTLKEVKGDIFRQRRRAKAEDKGTEQEWIARVRATVNSKKDSVRDRTFSQIEVAFARDHNWQYPSHEWRSMPVQPADWFRSARSVNELT